MSFGYLESINVFSKALITIFVLKLVQFLLIKWESGETPSGG